jgi:hypothetical protein
MGGMMNQLLGEAGDRVSMSFIAPTSVVTGTATVSFALTNGGDINATQTNNTIADRGDWIAPQANAALYEVQATLLTGGALTSGTMGSYVSLGTTRTWTLVVAPVQDLTSTVRFDFRRIGDTFIVNSQTVTFHGVAN